MLSQHISIEPHPIEQIGFLVVVRHQRDSLSWIHLLSYCTRLKRETATDLNLSRPAKPRRRGREQRLTGRGNRWSAIGQRHAINTNCIVAEAFVAVASYIESLD